MSTWGGWLERAMRERGLSRSDLIDRSPRLEDGRPALSRSLLSKWLHMGQQPRADRVLAVAQALGVPGIEALRAAGYLEPGDPAVIEDGDTTHLIVHVDDESELDAVLAFLRAWRGTRTR